MARKTERAADEPQADKETAPAKETDEAQAPQPPTRRPIRVANPNAPAPVDEAHGRQVNMSPVYTEPADARTGVVTVAPADAAQPDGGVMRGLIEDGLTAVPNEEIPYIEDLSTPQMRGEKPGPFLPPGMTVAQHAERVSKVLAERDERERAAAAQAQLSSGQPATAAVDPAVVKQVAEQAAQQAVQDALAGTEGTPGPTQG